MGEKLKLPSAGHSAEEYRNLKAALRVCLSADVKRIKQGGQRDLDRMRLQQAFDETGFRGDYFGLDFAAPLVEFLPALEHVHRQVLSGYETLARQYPEGEVDLDFLREG